MIKSRAVAAIVGIALVIAIGAMAGRTADASHITQVSLGAADSYAVFAAATITSSGPTTINGDLGLHPGTSVTGGPIVNGTQNVANAAALSARTLLQAAYSNAAGRTPDTTVTGDNLGGTTFVSGVYRGGALDLSTTLPIVTLDGENDPTAVFIFQAASTLTTAASTTVNLIRGAQACNVFWQVGSSATLGASSTFRGTILAHTSISVGTSANIDGRLLAGVGASTDSPSSDTGALTLLSNTITRPTCAVAPTAAASLPPCEFMVNLPNAPCAGTRPTATTQASATQTPSTPTVAPTVAAVATATPTVAPSAPTVAPSAPTATPGAGAAGIAGVQVLPSTSTGDTSGPLLMLGIALLGTGIVVLRRQIRHS